MDVSLIKASILLGIVLLGVGFAVGTDPTTHSGAECGSVLMPADPRDLGSGADAVAGCSATHDGGRWWATWPPLVLGGVAVLVGWTASRERDGGGSPASDAEGSADLR